MVHYSNARLDAVFGALADPTRRAVLAALCNGERTVGELAHPFGMSLTGFIKHLGVLEHAGLIERHKAGRAVSCRLKDDGMKSALEWLERHEQFWNARLDRLAAFLERKEKEAWTSQPKTRQVSASDASITRPSPPSTPRGRNRSK